MNVVISNEQQRQIATLDADIIKSITGVYSATEIVEMFKNFFYNKMVIDITSIKNYDQPQMYKILANGLDADKLVFFIPEGNKVCNPNFLAQLIDLGVYNFTTNIPGIKYLLKKSNTYNDVAQIHQMGGGKAPANMQQQMPNNNVNQNNNLNNQQNMQPAPPPIPKTIKIGVMNLTEHSGATSLVYMMRKELASVMGDTNVAALEVEKNDFQFFNDKMMVSTSGNNLKKAIESYKGIPVILIDLNNYEDFSVCDDILFLIEPSILKLNKLVKRNKGIFTKLKGRKIVLTQSMLTSKDVTDLEYEAGAKIFFNIPPLNDRKHNEIIQELISKLGLVSVPNNSNSSGKIFGLFRR